MNDYNTALLVDHVKMGTAELLALALTAGPVYAQHAPLDLIDEKARNTFGMLRAVEWQAATRMLNAVVRQGPKTAPAGIDIDHVMRLVGIVALMSAPKLAKVLQGIDMDQPHNLAIGVPLQAESAAQLVAYLETGAAVARPLDEWDESMGACLWWRFPVEEACYVGHPNCDDWPGYHTHFTPHPAMPVMGEPQVDPA